MTKREDQSVPWQGKWSLINKDILEKYLKGATSSIYYIAGPPALVTALSKMLQEAGIDDDDIRKGEFTGYLINNVAREPLRSCPPKRTNLSYLGGTT